MLAVTALLLLGCGKDDPQDSTPEAFQPTLPVAQCGMQPYSLLDMSQVGVLLDDEPVDGFELTAGGMDALLNLVPVDGLAPVPYGATVRRFRYTTQDRGQLQESTGLVAYPTGAEAAPEGGWPVLLMLHGFAGVFDACAPSADSLIGPALPALLASQGYAVIAPDYIGLNGMGAGSTAPHAPLVMEQLAIGAWDAWRAGLPLLAEEAEGPLRDDLVVWGASQGGHGALAVELAWPHYAPEAKLIAVIASTPASDLRAITQDAVSRLNDAMGLTALALARMWSWYAPEQGLDTLLTNTEPYFFADAIAELLASDPEECSFDAVTPDVDGPEDVYAPDFIAAAAAGDWEAAAPWGCFVSENSLSTSSIPRLAEVPKLMVYGELDTLIVPPLQEPDLTQLCADGLSAEVIQCADAPHSEASLWSLPEQLAWLEARLAGEPWTPSCGMVAPACCAGTPEEEECGAE